MKIQQIKFIEHQVFPANSTLTFFQEWEINIPKIFFIVGNNWAGKTHILESIYYWFKNIHWYEINSFSLNFNSLLNSQSYKLFESNKISKGHWWNNNLDENISVIYNSLNEVNFKWSDLISTTATTIDNQKIPWHKSENLSQIIPQLLVDIKSQDSDSRSLRMDNNPTKIASECNIVKKFDRFKDAFEKMYWWSKKFKKIEPINWKFSIIFEDEKWIEINIENFSTWEKQILFRVGDMLRNLNNLHWAIILIDEPETSLHPQRQQKYTQFILDIFDWLDVQIIIATHSPYILQWIREWESPCICIKLDKNNWWEIWQKIWYYPNAIKNPSINLINYLAYWIFDETLHIELYSALEIYSKKSNQNKLEERIKNKLWIITTKNFIYKIWCWKWRCQKNLWDSWEELLPIYIRNKIHHPIEIWRIDYTNEDLEESIKILLSLLQ